MNTMYWLAHLFKLVVILHFRTENYILEPREPRSEDEQGVLLGVAQLEDQQVVTPTILRSDTKSVPFKHRQTQEKYKDK